MTSIILFIICILASAIGSIVGAGGGVIIKPVLDMIGILPVSTVSFCSGCTVLAMSVCSLIRNRKDGVRLQFKTSTALAIGAMIGGLTGSRLFDIVKTEFENENVLGMIQSIVLVTVTFGVYLYICNKENFPSMHVKSSIAAILIGFLLGIVSSFLGIGGGPNNVAVLFFFFSMQAKEAAKNSLYIIIFSQISSIFTTFYAGNVPEFLWVDLCCMMLGGVSGALIGAYVSKCIDNKGVEKVLKLLSLGIVAINIFNIFKFGIQLSF